MPIRMVPDENKGQNKQRNTPRNKQNTGGGGGIFKILAMALPFLLKKPKLLLLIAAIAAVWYFTKEGCSESVVTDPDNQEQVSPSELTRGADLSPEEYDKAEIFEPLAEKSTNTLPERVSLEKFALREKTKGTKEVV